MAVANSLAVWVTNVGRGIASLGTPQGGFASGQHGHIEQCPLVQQFLEEHDVPEDVGGEDLGDAVGS
jgi:hypothetical protein